MKQIETKLIDDDYLKPYFNAIRQRVDNAKKLEKSLAGNVSLAESQTTNIPTQLSIPVLYKF